MITAANPWESSFGVSYDPTLRVWLADKFSQALVILLGSGHEGSIADLYHDLYLAVSGSHVSIYNTERFTNVRSSPAQEFFNVN